MMATKIRGTMMTSAWAPVKAANAVEAVEVEVATVLTRARPITITSSASNIFIGSRGVKGGYRRYPHVHVIAALTKGRDSGWQGRLPLTDPASQEQETVEAPHDV